MHEDHVAAAAVAEGSPTASPPDAPAELAAAIELAKSPVQVASQKRVRFAVPSADGQPEDVQEPRADTTGESSAEPARDENQDLTVCKASHPQSM